MEGAVKYDYGAFLDRLRKAAGKTFLECGKGGIGADSHCLVLSAQEVYENPAGDYHTSLQRATILFLDECVLERYRHEKTKEPQTDVYVQSNDVLPPIDRTHSIPNALQGVVKIDSGNVSLLVKQELLDSLDERVRKYFNLESEGKPIIGLYSLG